MSAETHPHADKIINGDALTDVFGYWPSFHDAEVHRLRLDRGGDGQRAWLEADVHVFEITRDVTPMGYLALRHHTIVTFRFETVTDLKLEDFNEQNALFGLSLKYNVVPAFPGMEWEVTFDSSHGMQADFHCSDVIVMSVEPFEAPEPLISVEELKTMSAEERRALVEERQKERRDRDGG